MTVICCCSFGIFTQFTFEKMLQATGKTFYTMITQGIGAIVNIILDPVLIFGLAGMPRMGVKGAAVATVIGQTIAGISAFCFNHMKNEEVKISRDGLKIEKQIVKQIYYKLQSFVFMPIFGMNNGLVPILAYNYGAGKKDRFVKTVKLGIMYAVIIMLIGLTVLQMVPELLLAFFDASETMIEIGVPALRTISISYLFTGFCIICGTVFQALGSAVYSMVVSIARQLVVLLPAAYLLSLTGSVNNVWWAFPIAEVMSLMVTIFFMIRINRKIISHIGETV